MHRPFRVYLSSSQLKCTVRDTVVWGVPEEYRRSSGFIVRKGEGVRGAAAVVPLPWLEVCGYNIGPL
jgi:hypothetical protein